MRACCLSLKDNMHITAIPKYDKQCTLNNGISMPPFKLSHINFCPVVCSVPLLFLLVLLGFLRSQNKYLVSM